MLHIAVQGDRGGRQLESTGAENRAAQRGLQGEDRCMEPKMVGQHSRHKGQRHQLAGRRARWIALSSRRASGTRGKGIAMCVTHGPPLLAALRRPPRHAALAVAMGPAEVATSCGAPCMQRHSLTERSGGLARRAAQKCTSNMDSGSRQLMPLRRFMPRAARLPAAVAAAPPVRATLARAAPSREPSQAVHRSGPTA